MKLTVPREILAAMTKAGCTNELVVQDTESRMWGEETIESSLLSAQDIETLKSCTQKALAKEPKGSAVALSKKLALLESLATKKGKPVCKPEIMAELLKEYFRECEHHWVFSLKNDEELLPYVVTHIEFHPARDRGETYEPAYVKFQASAHSRGEKTNISYSWEASDFGKGGCTVEELLDRSGLIRETPELFAQHQADIERYQSIRLRTGHQFLAVAEGSDYGETYDTKDNERHYYRGGTINFSHGDSSSRVVMDDRFEEGKNLSTTCTLWAVDAASRDIPVKLPVHPFVVVFSLDLHTFARVHVKQLTEYKYDKTAEGKLVLSADRKELIDILVRASQERAEDIVKGKSGGIIMLLSGPPGTGKTLTAEVYSEFVKRPLYVVQCSQLGVTAERLEQRLALVLERACRWNAILLIDEADVYIHERGTDVTQNAIVGVFLRVLEHFNGVLFMTTNRATVVDDAIMSRMIAHIPYTNPDKDEAQDIWKVLARQYGVDVSETNIKSFVEAFPEASGRSIKNMLRLAKVLAKARNTKVDLSLLRQVNRFQDQL